MPLNQYGYVAILFCTKCLFSTLNSPANFLSKNIAAITCDENSYPIFCRRTNIRSKMLPQEAFVCLDNDFFWLRHSLQLDLEQFSSKKLWIHRSGNRIEEEVDSFHVREVPQ